MYGGFCLAFGLGMVGLGGEMVDGEMLDWGGG